MSQKPADRNNTYEGKLFWKDTCRKNCQLMEIPAGGMLSEECSWQQPEVSLLTSSVTKYNRSKDFSSDKTLIRRASHLAKKKKKKKLGKITPEYKIQGCNRGRGIWLRTASQQRLLQGKWLQIWLQRQFQAVSWCEGNNSIHMDRAIPAGSDQGIPMVELKEQSSLPRGSTSVCHIGCRTHVNGLACSHSLRSHATERLESLSHLSLRRSLQLWVLLCEEASEQL